MNNPTLARYTKLGTLQSKPDPYTQGGAGFGAAGAKGRTAMRSGSGMPPQRPHPGYTPPLLPALETTLSLCYTECSLHRRRTPHGRIWTALCPFRPGNPLSYRDKNTSRGESDFRETLLARWENGEKLVLKLACNDFTTAPRLTIWQRCAEAYRQLGYYCPTILPDAEGRFPTVPYKGRSCLLWGETFSPYASAESFPEESITKTAFILTVRTC